MKKTSILALALMAVFGLASCNRQEIDPPQEGVQGKYLLTEITASTGDDDTKTNIQSNSVVIWSADDHIAVKGTDGALHYYRLRSGSGTPVGKFVPAVGHTPASYNSLSDITAIYPACAAELSGGELYVNVNNQDLSGNFVEKGLTGWNSDYQFYFTINDIKVAIPASTTQDSNGKLNFKFKQLGTCCSFIIDFTQAEQAPTLMMDNIERMQITTLEGVALGGRAKVRGTSLGEITNPLTTIDWTFVTSRAMSSVVQPMFVFFPEVTASTTLKITLTTTNHDFVFTGKPTQDFEPGKRLTFPITVDKNFTQSGSQLAYTSHLRTDVDQFYYYGGTNCLLIPTTNTIGYLDVTQYVTDSRWRNTKNTADIITHKPAVYAKIIWSEGADVIASDMVDASNDYKLKLVGSVAGSADAISTDINGKSTLTIQRGGSDGNALVGIYDSSNKLLWSYHIWCPHDDPTANMYEYTRTNSGNYTVMTMPLGAIVKANPGMSSPQNATGLYYQWGRKDPLGGVNRMSSANGDDIRVVYGPDQTTELNVGDPDYNITGGNLKDCEIWLSHSTETGADFNKLVNAWNATGQSKTLTRFMIEYTTSKPWMYICQSNQVAMGDSWLWGNGESSSTFPIMEDTFKSIFDPSPEGFRVAPQDLWVGFSKTKQNADGAGYSGSDLIAFLEEYVNSFSTNYNNANSSNGWTFYYQDWHSGPTDFYLAPGRRGLDGSVGNVGYAGRAWSSAIGSSISVSSHLAFHANNILPLSVSNRGYGMPVRCVKEY